MVVCAGGGGIPVVSEEDGHMSGIEAVIDKDFASSLLARELEADALLMLTDVDGVYLGWNEPSARRLGRCTPAELGSLSFAPGTMGPKVAAACEFVQETGGFAGIGALADATAILNGQAGTLVTN